VRGTAAEPAVLGRGQSDWRGVVLQRGGRYIVQTQYPSISLKPRIRSTRGSIWRLKPGFLGVQRSLLLFRGPDGPVAEQPTRRNRHCRRRTIINLLVFGKTTDGSRLKQNPDAGAISAPRSMIASSVSSQVTSPVSRKSPAYRNSRSNPVLGGNQQDPGSQGNDPASA